MSDDEPVEAALRAADVLMRVAARSVMEVDHIVTSPQLRILVRIATRGPQSPGDIATELGKAGLALDCAHYSGGHRKFEPAGARTKLIQKPYC